MYNIILLHKKNEKVAFYTNQDERNTTKLRKTFVVARGISVMKINISRLSRARLRIPFGSFSRAIGDGPPQD